MIAIAEYRDRGMIYLLPLGEVRVPYVLYTVCNLIGPFYTFIPN
jgi:hypothetical protein